MAGALDGVGLAAIGVGALFMYAGIKGYSIPQTVQNVVQGVSPAKQIQALPIGIPTGTGAAVGNLGVPGAAGNIAADFQQYAGKVPYVWAGASPKGWDCSGSCNYVICHDAGLDIPGYKGGTFTGNQHGPSTLGWLAWAPGHMTKISQAQVLENDLVIWQTHMGICEGGGQYISAYDTQDGTVSKPIHGGGPIGEIPTFWRIGVSGKQPSPPGTAKHG